jgi:hypothetical protein
MGESKEAERVAFRIPAVAPIGGIRLRTAKVGQTAFLRVDRHPVFLHPLWQHVHDPAGVIFPCEHDEKVVRT